MNLFDTWAKKNKRDHDTTVVGSGMIDLEPASGDRDELDIYIGSGGLLNASGLDKSMYFQEIRSKITEDHLLRLEAIFKLCKGRLEIFRRLEDEGIPLVYLVALGITSQEDVQSYITVKEKGLDVLGMKEESERLGVDENYRREVLSIEEGYPTLLNSQGKEIPDVNEDDGFFLDKGRRDTTIGNSNEFDDPLVVQDVSGVLKDVEVNEEDGARPPEVSGTDWQKRLNELVQDIERSKQEEVKAKKEKVQPSALKDKKRDRHVYVLADTIDLPEIDGYKFIQVTGIQGVNNFTVHKDNLLVITRQIPRKAANHFMNWLQGVEISGEKYRIVTLKSSSVKHPVIEEVISLTKEDLDEYYAKRDSLSYIGDGVGTFMDISSMLNSND